MLTNRSRITDPAEIISKLSLDSAYRRWVYESVDEAVLNSLRWVFPNRDVVKQMTWYGVHGDVRYPRFDLRVLDSDGTGIASCYYNDSAIERASGLQHSKVIAEIADLSTMVFGSGIDMLDVSPAQYIVRISLGDSRLTTRHRLFTIPFPSLHHSFSFWLRVLAAYKKYTLDLPAKWDYSYRIVESMAETKG